MTDLRQAAMLALEALVKSTGELHRYYSSPTDMQILLNHKVITALRKALEQPEQEPVAIVDAEGVIIVCSYKYKPGDKLYTTPTAQRPWVELAASTILNLMPSSISAEYDGALMDFARAIEARLKERNT